MRRLNFTGVFSSGACSTPPNSIGKEHDVLKLQKEKLEAKMEINIETSKLELEKKKIELETARMLAKIEIEKKQRLVVLEIQKMQDSLEK